MSAISRLYHGENNYDFTKGWKWGLRVSAVLFVVSLLSLATRHLSLGIDFEGGESWTVKAPGVTVEQTRSVLTPLGLGEAKVQTIGNDLVRVQASADTAEKQNLVRDELAKLGGVPASSVNVQSVGPTWGGEVTTSAARALVVFLLCILAYVTMTFRGEWKLAVGVVVAVIHDVVISVGVYSVLQFEVTPATVIAFLTILGYSIYDTVVVYDKVGENSARVGIAQRMTYTDMMNLSMNQVLLRSLNTSIVGVLPVLSTLVVGAILLGARTLEEFAIALTVGLVIGAYSSIFVAAPVVAWMKEKEPRNVSLRERLAKGDKPMMVRTPAGPLAPATAGGTPEETAAGGTGATGTRRPGGVGIATTIPPRPRKQGKKR